MSEQRPGLLAGHRALVTGGASGIGAATCRRFAEEGAAVAVLDLDGDGARAVADQVDGVAYEVDVADSGALEAAMRDAEERLGGLSLLFNNAGVGMVRPLHTYADEDWRRLLDVNLAGVFHGFRSGIPALRRNGGGVIVSNASVSAGRPTRGEGPYAAAKAGVIALSQAAALEYAPQIRVNTVSPGFIHTAMTDFAVRTPEISEKIAERTPLRRVGEAREVADAVVFLCSDLASYVTGIDLRVDGGSILPSAQSDELLSQILRGYEQER